jgi:hypothetical protein
VELALKRSDIGGAFRAYLKGLRLNPEAREPVVERARRTVPKKR